MLFAVADMPPICECRNEKKDKQTLHNIPITKIEVDTSRTETTCNVSTAATVRERAAMPKKGSITIAVPTTRKRGQSRSQWL